MDFNRIANRIAAVSDNILSLLDKTHDNYVEIFKPTYKIFDQLSEINTHDRDLKNLISTLKDAEKLLNSLKRYLKEADLEQRGINEIDNRIHRLTDVMKQIEIIDTNLKKLDIKKLEEEFIDIQNDIVNKIYPKLGI